MKKQIVSLLAVMLCVVSSHAQRLDFGGKIGANMTKIDGKNFKEGFELNYQLGFFGEIDFNDNFGIQPEVLFSQSTSSIDTSGFKSVYQNVPGAFTKKDVRLNYLNIPVLLRLNVGKLLTFNVGPQFSILVNDDKNLFENGKQAFKSGDFAAVLGAQVNISKLRIYGRYNIGLNDINDIDDSHKWRNQQLQVGVGFKIL